MPELTTRAATFAHARLRGVPQQALCGGFITEHYGRPARGLHALQIEINRPIYMDEQALQPHSGFERLSRDLMTLAESLLALVEAPGEALRDAAE
jgi:N-formylglutamate amidohydrolase